jgi:hypothetical protein
MVTADFFFRAGAGFCEAPEKGVLTGPFKGNTSRYRAAVTLF